MQNPEELKKIADLLDSLQRGENKGMGIPCIRQVSAYLRLGLLPEARETCFREGDEICKYPTICDFLLEKLSVDLFFVHDPFSLPCLHID